MGTPNGETLKFEGMSDLEFTNAFLRITTSLGKSDGELADILRVARQTVIRWKRGLNLPRQAMRRQVMSWMRAQEH